MGHVVYIVRQRTRRWYVIRRRCAYLIKTRGSPPHLFDVHGHMREYPSSRSELHRHNGLTRSHGLVLKTKQSRSTMSLYASRYPTSVTARQLSELAREAAWLDLTLILRRSLPWHVYFLTSGASASSVDLQKMRMWEMPVRGLRSGGVAYLYLENSIL